MNQAAEPRITLRVPGDWSHPRELLARMPAGYRLGTESLRLPNGTEIEFTPMPPDEQFARIFQSACRRPPKENELAVLNRYQVNVGLSGPGGSLESALTMMQAAAAIVRAGGAGVFIDNSAMAVGGEDWLAMTQDGGPEAISFAFVSIVRGPQKTYTMGMHVMGYPELQMRSSDVDERGEMVIELIRTICRGDRPVDVGHVLSDVLGLRIQIVSRENDEFDVDSPMHNPYGRLKVVTPREIAEGN